MNVVTDGDSRTDEAGSANSAIVDPSGPAVRAPSGGGSVSYTCKDPLASNYVTYGKHKDSKCEYPETIALAPTVAAPTDSVCTPYITSYIKLGSQNDTEDVKRLETFLNNHEGESLPVDGVYGQADFEAVNRFQTK